MMSHLHLSVFLAHIGDGVLVQDRVEANSRTYQWHVTEHGSECIEARLALDEVIRIVPRRPVKTTMKCNRMSNNGGCCYTR
jgi:hypothetical protein